MGVASSSQEFSPLQLELARPQHSHAMAGSHVQRELMTKNTMLTMGWLDSPLRTSGLPTTGLISCWIKAVLCPISGSAPAFA